MSQLNVYLTGESGPDDGFPAWVQWMDEEYADVNFVHQAEYMKSQDGQLYSLFWPFEYQRDPTRMADAVLVNFTHEEESFQVGVDMFRAYDNDVPIVILRDCPEPELPEMARFLSESSFMTADECIERIAELTSEE